jgi:hypothetical protein
VAHHSAANKVSLRFNPRSLLRLDSESIISRQVLVRDARDVFEQVLIALADRKSSGYRVSMAGNARLCD